MKNKAMLFCGPALLAIFTFMLVAFTVRQGDLAIVTRLGKPTRAITEPGLYFRWPFPVERIYRFDNRFRTLETAFEESLTQDGKNVLVSLFASWRIAEPVRFLERVGTIEQADSNLDGLIRAQKSAALGQVPFSGLVTLDPAKARFTEIETQILSSVAPVALERYGIEIEAVGINRLGLPEAITASVFERMRAERKELADRYKAEGEAEAIRVRAQADSQRAQLLATAEADARRLRAEGDASAARYYTVFEKNPELALFLRQLETLEETLKEKSTVILSADSEPYQLLKGSPSLKASP